MTSRIDRYGITVIDRYRCKSGKLENNHRFFEGDNVRVRMSEVRKSVTKIRRNWDQYDNLMSNLRTSMERYKIDLESDNDHTLRLSKIFKSRRNWIDRMPPGEIMDDNYDSIRLYTSKEGYNLIYSFMNYVLRSNESAEFKRIIDSVVFLGELINIDLFNYTYNADARLKDFNGIVYRGMCLPEKYIKSISKICKRPLSERYLAVPLGFESSSLNCSVALDFIDKHLNKSPSLFPLLLKIHVISLDDKQIGVYSKLFPESVVSGISAVPISDLSDFPVEEEVLLSGPFYQALNFYEKEIKGKPLSVLEVVMLNSNRSHLSNADLGQCDKLARIIFGTIVAIRRYQFCLDHSKKNCFKDDAQAYHNKLKSYNRSLKKLVLRCQLRQLNKKV